MASTSGVGLEASAVAHTATTAQAPPSPEAIYERLSEKWPRHQGCLKSLLNALNETSPDPNAKSSKKPANKKPPSVTVPVIVIPNSGTPITYRHVGLLSVELDQKSRRRPSPGRFIPLYPADDAKEKKEQGVPVGHLNHMDSGGHWANNGCIRLLVEAYKQHVLELLPRNEFLALWTERTEEPNGGSSSSGASKKKLKQKVVNGAGDEVDSSSGAAKVSNEARKANAVAAAWKWHVPGEKVLLLEEAYGGLCRELIDAGHDITNCHYMLRGWAKKDNTPAYTPKPTSVEIPDEKSRKLRAMYHWKGLLTLLEEARCYHMETSLVHYWLARMPRGFQKDLVDNKVLATDMTVHHIIARAKCGINHPLNYFLINKANNSAMGDRLEFLIEGKTLHMRDIVGDEAFEVASAACELYHCLLDAPRCRGEEMPSQKALHEFHQESIKKGKERVRQKLLKAPLAHLGGSKDGDGSPASTPVPAPPPRDFADGSQTPRNSKLERSQGQRVFDPASQAEDRPLSHSPEQVDRRRRLSDEGPEAGGVESGEDDHAITHCHPNGPSLGLAGIV